MLPANLSSLALQQTGDPAKAASNVRKHGVSFDEAETAFSDERADVIRLISARKATRTERRDYAARW